MSVPAPSPADSRAGVHPPRLSPHGPRRRRRCRRTRFSDSSFAADANDDAGRPLYAFPLLGDLHFDRMTHHDLDWVKREKGGDLRQIDGYVETTAKYTPRLFARVRQAIADSKVPVPFVLHVGDLVEGLCGSRDLHTTQCREAIAAVEAATFGVPVRWPRATTTSPAPGAPDAFNDVLLPWISGQLKQDLHAPAASYTLMHGDDLFVVFDAYKPDLDWLDRALAAAPSLPARSSCRPARRPLQRPGELDDLRQRKAGGPVKRLLDALAKRPRHRPQRPPPPLRRRQRQSDAGSIVQLAVSSVLKADDPKPREELAGVAQYTPDLLLNTEPKFAPESIELRRRIVVEEAPAIRRFEHADLPGFAMLHGRRRRRRVRPLRRHDRPPLPHRPPLAPHRLTVRETLPDAELDVGCSFVDLRSSIFDPAPFPLIPRRRAE